MPWENIAAAPGRLSSDDTFADATFDGAPLIGVVPDVLAVQSWVVSAWSWAQVSWPG